MGRGMCEESNCRFMIEEDLGTKIALDDGVNLSIEGDGRQGICGQNDCPHSHELQAVLDSIEPGTVLLKRGVMKIDFSRIRRVDNGLDTDPLLSDDIDGLLE